MRNSLQLELRPGEYRDLMKAERQAILRDLLDLLRRSHGEPWYRWVADSRPLLTEDEYRAGGGRMAAGRRRAA